MQDIEFLGSPPNELHQQHMRRDAVADGRVEAKRSRPYGFELGAGTELVTFQNFGVRADYTHVWYGSSSGFNPDEDDVRLGVAYHF